jgi:catechol 2,3-dioxygenase-like lactoylglutathione lyase family enzyme
MDKLRHISISVPDVEATAVFYENTFGLERVKENERIVCLSDGTINVTLTRPMDLDSTDCKDFVGVHHLGFVAEDKKATGDRLKAGGGRMDDGKCWDPNSIMVNISDTYWVGSK